MFRDMVRWGPSFPCMICHMMLFQHQVVQFDTKLESVFKENCSKNVQKVLKVSEKFYSSLEKEIHRDMLDYEYRMRYKRENPGAPLHHYQMTFTNDRRECYMCRVCCTNLKKGKIPPKAAANYLEAVYVPEDIRLESYLEEALIARILLFIKIFALKTSLMPAIKDRCVVIPLDARDVLNTVISLPRLPSESGIIDIQ